MATDGWNAQTPPGHQIAQGNGEQSAAENRIGGEQLFDALLSLGLRCQDQAVGLPEREIRDDIWGGVLFETGAFKLLAPLDEIGEVLEVPREVTPIPASREWVYGVANNRGTLLPMFDLQSFLVGAATTRNNRNRVMVVRREEFPVGLLVSGVIGIRHIETKSRSPKVPALPDMLAHFVTEGFMLGTEIYPVFSVHRLTQDERFNLAGA